MSRAAGIALAVAVASAWSAAGAAGHVDPAHVARAHAGSVGLANAARVAGAPAEVATVDVRILGHDSRSAGIRNAGIRDVGFLDAAQEPTQHTIEIVSIRPHDGDAFTQGLLLHEGRLFESTGRRGTSTVREVDPVSGAVLRQQALPASDFGEGLARVDDRLIQITWQAGIAHVWDLESFAPRTTFAYEGEGWGLCYDGARLAMTDGGSRLIFRDPATFAELGRVTIWLRGAALRRVNELECVGDRVWGNVWFEDFIVAIDPVTGNVTDIVDASALMERIRTEYPTHPSNVLNGIAFDPDTGHWLLTGKLWPELYEVRFVPVGAAPSATPVGPATPSATPVLDATPTATATPLSTATATPTATEPASLWMPFAWKGR